MAIEVLDLPAARSASVEALGLNKSIELGSPEALAAAIRRTASFLCPTSSTELVTRVTQSLAWLLDGEQDLGDRIGAIVQALISYGDLLELPAMGETRSRNQTYLGPPAFLRRQSGACVLLGIRPEAVPLVGDELLPLVEYRGHVRSIPPKGELDVPGLLIDYGLYEMPKQLWLRMPAPRSPEEVIRAFDRKLDAAGASGIVDGLKILDGTRAVTYYVGRWRVPTRTDSGRFVARRPQAYGANLWCYAELVGGQTTRIIDLPVEPGLSKAYDEAWRLQAAMDARRGNPQVLRVRRSQSESVRLELLSPPPSWLQRRWDIVGTPTARGGALIAYAFSSAEIAEEIQVAREMLWLRVEDQEAAEHAS